MSEDKKMTGYPSIDKPWLKYYKAKPEDIYSYVDEHRYRKYITDCS